jgi:glycosyltransferase involved in cell wall biosynthesis
MRVFLVDPTCVRRDTHSWDSLIRFQSHIQAFSEWELEISIPNEESINMTDLSKLEKIPYRNQILGKKKKLSWFGFVSEVFEAYFRLKRLILSQQHVGLLLPNADPGSIAAILFLAKRYPKCNFFIRLIGWTEFWTPGHPFLIKFIVARVTRFGNVTTAAETEPLRKFFNLNLIVPYPLEAQNIDKGESNYLFLAGSARKEKGFKLLPILANQLKIASSPFIIVAQRADSRDKDLLMIEDRLSDCKNILLLPSYLPRHELIDWIEKSRAVLLPYNSRAYKLRGSAILFEAIERSTPTIAFKGGGYEKDVIDFNLGEIAFDENDVISALRRFTDNSLKKELYQDFASYSLDCLRLWLNLKH